MASRVGERPRKARRRLQETARSISHACRGSSSQRFDDTRVPVVSWDRLNEIGETVEGLGLEQEFDGDGYVSRDWLSVLRGRLVSVLLEGLYRSVP